MINEIEMQLNSILYRMSQISESKEILPNHWKIECTNPGDAIADHAWELRGQNRRAKLEGTLSPQSLTVTLANHGCLNTCVWVNG